MKLIDGGRSDLVRSLCSCGDITWVQGQRRANSSFNRPLFQRSIDSFDAGPARTVGFAVRWLVGLIVLLAIPTSQSFGVDPVFTNATEAAGLTYVQRHQPFAFSVPPNWQPDLTGGAAAGDYDNDGLVDLFVTRNDDPPILFRNKGDGTFEDVTATAGLDLDQPTNSNGTAWADIDNDGDEDLYVTAFSSNRYYLYINDGNGHFTEDAVARGASVQGADTHYGQSVSFGDYDRDGYVDMHVTEWRHDDNNPTEAPSNSRLLRNLGTANPGHFEDVTIAAGVVMDEVENGGTGQGLPGTFTFISTFVDLDHDGWQDLAVVSDFGESRLFWNNHDGTFADGTLAASLGTDQHGMGSAIADYNGDGLLDWFVTSIYNIPNGQDGNRLYRNLGNRTFIDATSASGVRDGSWGWGAAPIDFDNDGDKDIVHTNGVHFDLTPYVDDAARLFENDGTGAFTEIAASAGINDLGLGKGLLTFDYDRDGDLDVFIVNHGTGGVLYRNDGGNEDDWIEIDTVGTVSNRDGLGAFITLTPEDGGPSQVHAVIGGSHFLAQSDDTAHFGLGDMSTDPDGLIDTIEIRWLSGIIQTLTDVPIDALLTVYEPQLGDMTQDGQVDIGDFTLWGDSFGDTGEGLVCDVSFDGRVDIGDFTIWGDHFGSTTLVTSTVSAVPEPGGLALLSLGITGLLAVLWRRRR